MKSTLMERLVLAEKYFKSTRYADKLSQALAAFNNGRIAESENVLSQLPTRETLMSELLERLKEKPVYKTLRKLAAGSSINMWEKKKAVSSLITHCLIECEQGNLEFKMLADDAYIKLGQLLYEGADEQSVEQTKEVVGG